MKFRKADLIIIVLPLLISVLSIIGNLPTEDYDTRIANIIVNGKTVISVDLEESENKEIDLDLSENNIIQIKDGSIRIKSADCNDKTCVNTGFISSAGDCIVCVPSKLIIEIEGQTKEYDAVLGGVQ